MTKDKTTKNSTNTSNSNMSRKEIVTRGASKKTSTKDKKKEEKNHRRKSNEDTDSGEDEFDSDYDEEDDEEYEDEDEEEEDEMDVNEYRKFLSKIFPSKHLNEKIKNGDKLKKLLKEDTKKSAKNEKNEKSVKSVKSVKSKKSKKPIKKQSDTESDDESSECDDEESDYEESEEDALVLGKKGSKEKFNIIFTIGQNYDEDEDDWEDYDEDEDEDDGEETEDEDEEVSTDEDSDYETEEEEEEEEVPKKKGKIAKQVKSPVKSFKKTTKDEKTDVDEDSKETKKEEIEETSTSKTNVLSQLRKLQEENKGNKLIEQCLETYEKGMKENKKKMEKKEKKQKEKNSRIFKRVVRDKNTMNDFAFFEKMELENQKKIIKEVREINKLTRVEKPYRLTLLESEIPVVFKAAAMKKIASLRYMEPGSGEYYKMKNWVDTFMRVPFGKIESLPVNISHGVEKCHDFMEQAQKTLDSAVYGLNDAKMQIMQMMGQLITNPMALGTAIAIKGAMGTGKTSIVKEGISKILNRPFAFIALGGATDSSFLEGHSYTYEGSIWGKIVQILIDSKCMNPVIYFDELDKISDTPKGEEIAGILTHLTDTSQNSQFHDKYFSEIDFDLSKCLFIFSYNDESKVNPILRDRMYKIQTKGYDKKDKTVIANDYLLPKIREQVKFEKDDIVIPDETIHYIIENHCAKEEGVRNMKRCLEIIYTKLNLYRLMKPGSNLFEEDMSLKVEFPFTVTNDIVDKLIKKEKNLESSLYGLYV